MKLYVTYGNGYDQRKCYSIVEGKDTIDCMKKVQAVCGRHYAFTYTEAQFKGQPEKYELREIPLQAQTKDGVVKGSKSDED